MENMNFLMFLFPGKETKFLKKKIFDSTQQNCFWIKSNKIVYY
jgi:hypothetical protein